MTDMKDMDYLDDFQGFHLTRHSRFPEVHRKIMDAELDRSFAINLGPDATTEDAHTIRRQYYSKRNKKLNGFGITSKFIETKRDGPFWEQGDMLLVIQKQRYPPT